MAKRRNFSAAIKAKLALEALRGATGAAVLLTVQGLRSLSPILADKGAGGSRWWISIILGSRSLGNAAWYRSVAGSPRILAVELQFGQAGT